MRVGYRTGQNERWQHSFLRRLPKLNDLLKNNAYPLPCVDICLDALFGSLLLSTFDLLSRFDQVAVDLRDVNKTTFISNREAFSFP